VDPRRRRQTDRVDERARRYRSRAHRGVRTWFAVSREQTTEGYAVALQQVVVTGVGGQQKQRKVNGAVCKGPSSSAIWPEDGLDLDRLMKPSRVTWLRELPAVAMVEGNATDRLGARRDDAVVFLDCKEVVDQAMWFGAGYWGLRRQEVWTIYSGDKAIGSIAGVDLRASPKK
jgi:hypothetical protein